MWVSVYGGNGLGVGVTTTTGHCVDTGAGGDYSSGIVSGQDRTMRGWVTACDGLPPVTGDQRLGTSEHHNVYCVEERDQPHTYPASRLSSAWY